MRTLSSKFQTPMFKKLDKVLAAFGNIRAMERLHVDTFTEEKIESVPGDPIAASEEGRLHAGVQELNGYLFLETILVSGQKFKTFNGATLSFSGGSEDFVLKSDTQEIDSDHSNVSNRYLCEVSFDVTQEEIDKLLAQDYDTVIFQCKKKTVTMNKVQLQRSDEEE